MNTRKNIVNISDMVFVSGLKILFCVHGYRLQSSFKGEVCANQKVLYRSKMPRVPEILRVEISYLSMVDGREMERRVPETRNAVVIVAAVSQHVGRAGAHYKDSVIASDRFSTAVGTLSGQPLGFRTLAGRAEKLVRCSRDRVSWSF